MPASYHRWRTVHSGGRPWSWTGLCTRCNIVARGQQYLFRAGVDPYFQRLIGPRPRCGPVYPPLSDEEILAIPLGPTSPFAGGRPGCPHAVLRYFGRNEGIRCAANDCRATWLRHRDDGGTGVSELRRLLAP